MKMNKQEKMDENQFSEEILKRIERLPGPNVRLTREIKRMRLLWFVGCLVGLIGSIWYYFGEVQPNQWEATYAYLQYIPVGYAVLLVLLGYFLFSVKKLPER